MEGKARLSLTSSINAHRVATCDKKLFDILQDDLLLFPFFFIIFLRLGYVKGMIFILNSNLTSLSFYEIKLSIIMETALNLCRLIWCFA